MSRSKNILIIIIVLLAVGLGVFFWNSKSAVAPGGNPDWKTFTDPNSGATFSYPPELGTKYISTIDWPPAVYIPEDGFGGEFTCTEAGNETDRAGKTEKKTINGHDYCVTRVAEGAAGSIYTQYAYAFEKDDVTTILTFSLRATQCGNYDDTEKAKCEAERASFNIDSAIDQIASSLEL
ncbi:MAG TPA: hypothetical protein VJB95_00250 [Candidatus Paceibacterota bacterium]